MGESLCNLVRIDVKSHLPWMRYCSYWACSWNRNGFCYPSFFRSIEIFWRKPWFCGRWHFRWRHWCSNMSSGYQIYKEIAFLFKIAISKQKIWSRPRQVLGKYSEVYGQVNTITPEAGEKKAPFWKKNYLQFWTKNVYTWLAEKLTSKIFLEEVIFCENLVFWNFISWEAPYSILGALPTWKYGSLRIKNIGAAYGGNHRSETLFRPLWDKTDFFTHLSHVRRLEHCRDNHDVTKDTAYYHQCIQCDKCIKYWIGYSLIVKDILQ